MVDARFVDARAHAPEEGELVDRHVQHPVVHDLLDLVQHRLALLSIQLPRLPSIEILDLRHHTRGVDPTLGHVGLDARGRVAGRRAEAHDDALDLVLAPRREKCSALHRAYARADAGLLQIVADGFGEREVRRERREVAGVEARRISRLGEQLLGPSRVIGGRLERFRELQHARHKPAGRP